MPIHPGWSQNPSNHASSVSHELASLADTPHSVLKLLTPLRQSHMRSCVSGHWCPWVTQWTPMGGITYLTPRAPRKEQLLLTQQPITDYWTPSELLEEKQRGREGCNSYDWILGGGAAKASHHRAEAEQEICHLRNSPSNRKICKGQPGTPYTPIPEPLGPRTRCCSHPVQGRNHM